MPCGVDANGGVFTMANKYLSADLLFFTARGGGEATSPSFAAKNAAIEASSASLETVIATRYKQGDCAWEQFTPGKQIPVCRSFVLYKWRGRRGNVAHFYKTLRGN